MLDRKEYDKQYYINNREKIREHTRQYRINNLKKMRERVDQYRINNPEKVKERHRRYYINNLEKIKERDRQYQINNLEKRREREKNRRKTDLKFNLNHKISSAIYISLKGNKAGNHWESLVKYTLNDLIKHLKKTIPEGFTEIDMLNGKLHIDHIVPISAFNFTEPEHTDFKRCWTLENLRLLPARENIIKRDKLFRPFQPALAI